MISVSQLAGCGGRCLRRSKQIRNRWVGVTCLPCLILTLRANLGISFAYRSALVTKEVLHYGMSILRTLLREGSPGRRKGTLWRAHIVGCSKLPAVSAMVQQTKTQGFDDEKWVCYDGRAVEWPMLCYSPPPKTRLLCNQSRVTCDAAMGLDIRY